MHQRRLRQGHAEVTRAGAARFTGAERAPQQRSSLHHLENGSNILQFVRQRRLAEWGTAPCTLLGPASYASHTGERPIQFVWRLRRAMPADFFRRAKVATA